LNNNSQRKTQWKIILPVLALLLLGLGLILFDRDRILQILAEADWKVLPGALFFLVCSNALVSFSYVILAPLVGIPIGWSKVWPIFFVTNAMNRLVRSGGVAGFSLRYLMMKPYGVGLTDVLNSSFLHFLLGSLVMLGTLPVVVIYILVALPVAAGMMPVWIFLAITGVLLCFGLAYLLFSERILSRAARLVIRLGKKIARRDVTALVAEYTQRTTWAVNALRRNWWGFSTVMLLLFGEWLANVVVLGYCLKAFGAGLSFGGVAAIYVVASMLGAFTTHPGGIGVQEVIMTSLAVLQGFSFEQAVLAAILYRILQTFLPYLLSFGFYPRLLKTGLAEV
jgi:uncharacterized protein (TIRG00374 family)